MSSKNIIPMKHGAADRHRGGSDGDGPPKHTADDLLARLSLEWIKQFQLTRTINRARRDENARVDLGGALLELKAIGDRIIETEADTYAGVGCKLAAAASTAVLALGEEDPITQLLRSALDDSNRLKSQLQASD